jgi:hypothetical protein
MKGLTPNIGLIIIIIIVVALTSKTATIFIVTDKKSKTVSLKKHN